MTGVPARLAAALAALTLGLGAAACGDSDDDGGGNANASQDDQSTAQDSSGGERAQVAAVMPALSKSYNSGDGAGFCALLNAKGKREMSDYAVTIPALKATDCVKFMNRYTQKVVIKGGAKHTPVRIRKIAIDGDTAKVTMGGGLAGIRSIATYTLVQEDGQWKLSNPITGAKSRTLPKKYQN